MTDIGLIEGILAGADVDAAVFALRPDYRSLPLAVDGLVPSPSDEDSDALLQMAEDAARQALSHLAVARVNRLTDTYNAIAVLHQMPLGGEDLTQYAGSLFILDALDAMTDEALHTAADDLVAHLTRLGPDVQVIRRLIASGTTPEGE